MRIQRVIVAGIAAGVLVVAAGCRSSSGTSTTTSTYNGGSMTSSSTTTDNGVVSTAPDVTSTTSVAPTENGAVATTQTTVGTQPGTAVIDNGTTRTVTSTTVTTEPNGTTTVATSPGTATNMTSSSSLATNNGGTSSTYVANGAQVTTRTVTTTTATREAVPAYASASVTTAPCNTQYPAMTSSSQTIYTPAPMYSRGRSGRGLDLLLFADRASFSNSNTNVTGGFDTGALRTDIRHENGYGLGLNAYWTPNFSTEFTASRVKPTATFTPTTGNFNPITGMRIRMTPITGTLQFHFLPHKGIDPYIGGGAAYVMFHTENNSAFNPGNTGLTSVNFRDEWGPLANAGLNFGLSHGFGINLDAKYMWVRARAQSEFNNVTIGNVGNGSRLGLNPFLLSAGLRFGF